MTRLSCGGKGPCCHEGRPHRHCEGCDVAVYTDTVPAPEYPMPLSSLGWPPPTLLGPPTVVECGRVVFNPQALSGAATLVQTLHATRYAGDAPWLPDLNVPWEPAQ